MPKKFTRKEALFSLLGAMAFAVFWLVDVYWLPDVQPPPGLYAKSGWTVR